MEVLNIIENKDGSATIEVEIKQTEMKLLAIKAITDLLLKGMGDYNEETNLGQGESVDKGKLRKSDTNLDYIKSYSCGDNKRCRRRKS
jgi:hypothetical protein